MQEQAFQNLAIAKLGRALSNARSGDGRDLNFLEDGAKRALEVWPFQPVRLQ